MAGDAVPFVSGGYLLQSDSMVSVAESEHPAIGRERGVTEQGLGVRDRP